MSLTLSAENENFHASAGAIDKSPNTILVVEDDDAIGSLLTILLAPLGLSAVHVTDAAACLRWFSENASSTALVILDCSLPDSVGDGLARNLRTITPGLPLLLTSGMQRPDMMRTLGADGPTDFLPKPFRPAQLVKHVRGLIPNRIAA